MYLKRIGAYLRQNKRSEFMEAVLDTVHSLVVVLDPCGSIIRFNRACEKATGYKADQVLGKCCWDVFLIPEDREAAKQQFLEMKYEHHVRRYESEWITKSGKRLLIAWSNAPMLGKSKAVQYVIATGNDITESRRLEQLVLEVSQNERQRMGEELHDGIAQHLTSTAIAAKILEKKLSRRSIAAAQELKRIVAMVNEAVKQTRELAHGLYHHGRLSTDLITSLKELAHQTTAMLGVRCVVDAAHGLHRISGETANQLYNIAQESVRNALKHGRSKMIRLRVRKKSANSLELLVISNGKRFSRSTQTNGLGLRIMQSRASKINGSLTVAAGLRGGTVVSCVFPTPS